MKIRVNAQSNPVKAVTLDKRRPCPFVQFHPKVDSPRDFRAGLLFARGGAAFGGSGSEKVEIMNSCLSA